MQINALRYRAVGNNQSKTFHFSSGKPQNMGFQALCIEMNDAHLLQSCLNFLLTGKANNYVNMASINISDFAGQSWVIERVRNELKIKRNNETVSNSEFPQLIQSLFDADELIEFQDKNLCQLTSIATDDGKEFFKVDASSYSSNEKILLDKLTNDIKAKERKISEYSGLKSDELTIATGSILELISRRNDLLELKNSLSSQVKSSTFSSTSTIDQLRSQINLLTDLNELCGEFLIPQNAPHTLREKLKELDEEIKKHQSQKKIGSIADLTKGDEWNHLINLRCRIKILSKLSEQSSEYSNICKNELKPLLTNYTKVIETVRSSDHSTAQELEQSITDIYSTVEEINKQASLSPFSEFFQAFKKGTPPTEAHHKLNLEHTKETLEYLKKHLSNIGTNVKNTESKLSKTQDVFDQFSNNIKIEKEKLIKAWTEKCEELLIPKDSTLVDIITMASSVGKFSDLYQKRSEIVAKLERFDKSLPEMKKTIIELRRISNSQNLTGLERESLIISECSNALRYLKQKRAQLRKLEVDAENRSVDELKAKIDTENLKQAEKKFSTIVSTCNLPNWDASLEYWKLLASDILELNSLKNMISNLSANSLKEKINFSTYNEDTLVNIRCISIKENNFDKELEAINLLLDGSFPGSLQLICSSNREFINALSNHGVSCGNELISEIKSPNTRVSTTPNSEPEKKSLFSKKALDSINALKAKTHSVR